jgi:protein CpxP
MKHAIFTALLAAGLATSPAVAQQSQHQHDTSAPAEAQPGQGGMMQGGMMQGGMMQDSEAMQAHRQKMQEMQALMQKAHATTDPAKRQQLMAEHRQMMQAKMASMMLRDNAAMMQACQERMAMMHDMMGQMAAEQEMTPAK